MNKDRLIGTAKQIRGSVKQVVGRAIGDNAMQADGQAGGCVGRSLANVSDVRLAGAEEKASVRAAHGPFVAGMVA